MVMRLEVRFARPLDRKAKISCALAAATLIKVRSVRFPRGDRTAVVMAHELSRDRLRQAFTEEGLEPEEITTSLTDDSLCDDAGTGDQERVKAPGR